MLTAGREGFWLCGRVCVRACVLPSWYDCMVVFVPAALRGRQLPTSDDDSASTVRRVVTLGFGVVALVASQPPADRWLVYRCLCRFPKEFDETSSHRFRDPTDVQVRCR